MWSVSYTTYPKEEETDFEKEPEFVAVIRNADGETVNSILSTNKETVKNWLISEIKKLDISDCYTFSMYEVEED